MSNDWFSFCVILRFESMYFVKRKLDSNFFLQVQRKIAEQTSKNYIFACRLSFCVTGMLRKGSLYPQPWLLSTMKDSQWAQPSGTGGGRILRRMRRTEKWSERRWWPSGGCLTTGHYLTATPAAVRTCCRRPSHSWSITSGWDASGFRMSFKDMEISSSGEEVCSTDERFMVYWTPDLKRVCISRVESQ